MASKCPLALASKPLHRHCFTHSFKLAHDESLNYTSSRSRVAKWLQRSSLVPVRVHCSTVGNDNADLGQFQSVRWKSGTFSANGIDISFHHTLDNRELPLLVFLHGLTCCGPVMIPLISNLSTDFHILLPSARGHGGSQPIPRGSFTMENLVNDAVRLIEFYSPPEKVFLAGHSMGAATAARVAKKIPEQIRGLVLEDPPWLRLEGEPVDLNVQGPNPFGPSRELKQLPDEEFQSLNRARNPEFFTGLPHSPLAVTQLESERMFDADGIEPTFRETDGDINEAVAGISVPTLLQTGGGAHAVCSAEVAEETMLTWQRGSLLHFPSANHVIHDPPHSEEWLHSVRRYFRSLV